MNVYDFDKTLYPRDSTLEFYLVSLLHHPSFLLDLPRAAVAFFRYRRGRITLRELREASLASFGRIKRLEEEVERFWQRRKGRLYAYYKEIRRPDDVVISASPEFLLEPICNRLGIGTLMASKTDKHTGLFDGKNCHGEEKVVRFRALFPNEEVDEFYSDLYCDTPMARLAKRAYIVKGEKLTPWKTSKLK